MEKMEIGKIEKREIVSEMRESYLDYAMSVIISRALPDVRDGLKPVHRRILYVMKELGLDHSAKYKKCAAVVGDTIARYHPHGDQAVYDALVRFAQEFSMRYPLIDGQGNFGSIDGDPAAAYRYTESKLMFLAEELLGDLEKDTVDWQPNYDGTKKEPKVLPAKIPNLLLNGALGIAVGMATNIPPHNLGEISDALSHLIDNPNAETSDLLKIVSGPDFPTGGIIYNKKEISEAYKTGRGPIVVRGRAEIIVEGKRHQIIISEIPYAVIKSSLVEKIASLAVEKKIEGIKDIRDESDREGMRIVIDLKTDSQPQKILNQLYQFTDLQKTFHMHILALVNGIQPRTLSLKEVLEEFLKFRQEVIRRRTQFELDRAKERHHILEGLSRALADIDAVIKTIRTSKDRESAKLNLMKKFKFTEIQAVAILEMRLQTLVNLEREKIEAELKEKIKLIKELTLILKEPKRILVIIKDELKKINEKFADKRRTQVVSSGLSEFKEEDLIKEEDVIIAISSDGYIKRIKADAFKVQKRGGKGVSGGGGTGTDSEEDVETASLLFSCKSHDRLLFFSNFGKVYQTKAYEVPEGSRNSKGKAILNLFSLSANEKINTVLNMSQGAKEIKQFLTLATKYGIIKRTELSFYDNIKGRGIAAMKLKNGDEVIGAKITYGDADLILITKLGRAIRFKETKIRPLSRNSSGIKGIRLAKNDGVVVFDAFGKDKNKIILVTYAGFAKQTDLKEYRLQNRGGSGIKVSKITAKTGPVSAGLVYSLEAGDLIITSSKGQIIRIKITAVPVLKRTSQGVKVLKLAEGDSVSSAAVI